jgi:hypothetical protein
MNVFNFFPRRVAKTALKRYLNPYLVQEISLDQIESHALQQIDLKDLEFDSNVRRYLNLCFLSHFSLLPPGRLENQRQVGS